MRSLTGTYVLTLSLYILGGPTSAPAQQSATLAGTVHDVTGGVVEGATLSLHNEQTGESFAAVTQASGLYTIPLVKPGNYALTAEAPGFKQYIRKGLRLETGASARVDFQLEIGTLAESVTIEAAAPLLNTDSSSIGSVVRNSSIANLPLINRRAAQLARLNRFVVQNGNGSSFAMAGGRGDNTMWTIDGGSAQNVLLGVATLSFDPPVEALEEFSVEIANYKAELGRSGGGYVQMTTKSGTNQWHGSAYEFFRNDALDSRNFFAASKPALRYNQFGASLGGAIKKDRTFFFANYEGIRNNRQSTTLASVPSSAERRGDFSALATAVRDPQTGLPYANNIIPTTQLDPVGAAVAGLYPDPNVPGARSRNNNFLANQPIANPTNTGVLRIDHNFSDKDRIYGRLLANASDTINAPVYPVAGVDPFHSATYGTYYSAAANWQHSFSPTTTLEARYTYERRKHQAPKAAPIKASRKSTASREPTSASSRRSPFPDSPASASTTRTNDFSFPFAAITTSPAPHTFAAHTR